MGDPAKILIIDDDPDLLFAVQAFLEAEGYRVLTAKTGMEGLERVRLDKPDLILLDLMIEKHDTGFQVAKTIKNDPAMREIPIIMVSAVRERTGFGFDQIRDGHWMKTSAFMEKPYELATVLEKIRELLSAKS
jgi:CheY-like chemotaxis protein